MKGTIAHLASMTAQSAAHWTVSRGWLADAGLHRQAINPLQFCNTELLWRLQLFRHRGLYGNGLPTAGVPELQLHAVQVVTTVTCSKTGVVSAHIACVSDKLTEGKPKQAVAGSM